MATSPPIRPELHSNNARAQSAAAPDASPWLKHYPSCVPAQLEYPEIPAWGFLDRTARQHPQRTACIYYNQQLNYCQLEESARRFAGMLVRLGVQPQDNVGILLPNTPEFLVALNGTWMAGAVAVALSPLMVAEEASSLMAVTGCRVVICMDLLLPLITGATHQPDHVIVTTIRDRVPAWKRPLYSLALLKKVGWRKPANGPERHSFNEELAKSDANFKPRAPNSLDDSAFILGTGGTTGKPKAVVLSHRNLVANANQLHHWAGGRVAARYNFGGRAVFPLLRAVDLRNERHGDGGDLGHASPVRAEGGAGPDRRNMSPPFFRPSRRCWLPQSDFEDEAETTPCAAILHLGRRAA